MNPELGPHAVETNPERLGVLVPSLRVRVWCPALLVAVMQIADEVLIQHMYFGCLCDL